VAVGIVAEHEAVVGVEEVVEVAVVDFVEAAEERVCARE